MDSILEKIKKDIESHRVILFMKGTKMMPVCGFSARVVSILNELEIPYETRNVLDDDKLRQGIKDFSNWPTIPQLYIDGKFIGGCDIVTEMHTKGDLKRLVS
ncbi:MAG: Grx4 family monothiol glutaredoxin [Simkania sp.]|jgi:monothiol glutaredoxin|nr:Grx4 family monothiol glutaredoxin [Simkania sp.]MCB1074256.1 Grx4 family monothiol glutaredoxin [Simkania sp.]MCB1083372.1 Grx4 family monothiol glutaredoxin [Simkania sp.]MCP5489914.1 Grx4 family monothiol glutaredoxin [Chlamydiales bacterium]